MPNPWKKLRAAGGDSVSRILTGLRPPEQGGSLVVQTGFPTSLADLVVKNSGRLKKPARKNKTKKPPTVEVESAPSTAAAAYDPPLDVSHRLRPHAVLVAGPPVSAEGGSCRPSFSSIESERRRPELLSVVMVVLISLAIERKKLVAGTTLFAFVLWLLGSLKPCSDVKSALNSVVRVCDFAGRGVASPIRELSVGSCSDTVSSERSSVELLDVNQGSEVRDIAGVGKVLLESDFGSKGNSKTKKLLSKFMPRKFRRRRVGKEGEEREKLTSDFRERGASESNTEIDESVNAIEFNGEDVASINGSANCRNNRKEEDEDSVQENLNEPEPSKSQPLLLGALVLLGLLGGKGAAVALTISWCLLHNWIELLRKKGIVLLV